MWLRLASCRQNAIVQPVLSLSGIALFNGSPHYVVIIIIINIIIIISIISIIKIIIIIISIIINIIIIIILYLLPSVLINPRVKNIELKTDWRGYSSWPVSASKVPLNATSLNLNIIISIIKIIIIIIIILFSNQARHRFIKVIKVNVKWV